MNSLSPSTLQFVSGSGPSAGTYGEVRNATLDILCFQGIRPILSWVNDDLFFWIKRSFLPEYNGGRPGISTSLSKVVINNMADGFGMEDTYI
jgi:hypothetical protein